ncbi:MAG TPA: hypothetical protein VN512_12990 [Clostridia bacterium]|nr:hypothetical protein [Clostridia bacterium]
MDVHKIYLSLSEKWLLRKACKHVINRAKYLTNKNVQALISYELLMPCMDDRFPTVFDEYGNSQYNAYRVTDDGVRYRLYARSRFWGEFRAWLAIIVSIVALVISAISLICALRGQKIELTLP